MWLQDTGFAQRTLAARPNSIAGCLSTHRACPGNWALELTLWREGHGALGPAYRTQLRSSGLGHEMTLSWWGDCENVDMRWSLNDAETNEVVLLSVPLAAGDTMQQTWCLTEGVMRLVV